MVTVRLVCNPRFGGSANQNLKRTLSKIVPTALDTAQDPITCMDISIFDDSNPLSHHDVEVRIFVNDVPARRENLDERRNQIIDGLKHHLPAGTSIFVWIMCASVSCAGATA